jgi:lipopolysaccharide export system permease protein
MILSWYVTRSYLLRFFALLFGLVLFLQMLDLLATADSVLDGGGEPAGVLGKYIFLRLPSIIETVAPLAGLLGALTALVVLARNSEIVAMRAAGRSVLSLVGGLVATGFVLALGLFFFSNSIVVRFNAQLEDWKSAGYAPGDRVLYDDETWLIEGSNIIRIGQVLRNGTVLNGIRVFRATGAAAYGEVINIRLAIWESESWKIFEAESIKGSESNSLAPSTPIVWSTNLRPEDFNKLANPPSQLTFDELEHYVNEFALGTRPDYYYDTWLQRKMSGPMVLALMPLLAAIAAFAHHREGSAVMVILYGIILGFVFIITDNLMLALGQFGALPSFIAAWFPLALFVTIGVWIVLKLEDSNI